MINIVFNEVGGEAPGAAGRISLPGITNLFLPTDNNNTLMLNTFFDIRIDIL